ncbi:MAG: hypothetical protein ACYC3X_24805 [Pirellulaceae bacterium]
MKHIYRSPLFASGMVTVALLAFLAPTPNSRVNAQVQVLVGRYQDGGYYRPYQDGGYYRPYTQGPSRGYGRGYAAAVRPNSRMFPSRGGVFVSQTYRYSRNSYIPSGQGNRLDYGIGPVRVYGRSGYYQPSDHPVYVPFGYWGY